MGRRDKGEREEKRWTGGNRRGNKVMDRDEMRLGSGRQTGARRRGRSDVCV